MTTVICKAKYCEHNKKGEYCKKGIIKLSFFNSDAPVCEDYRESDKKRKKYRGW